MKFLCFSIRVVFLSCLPFTLLPIHLSAEEPLGRNANVIFHNYGTDCLDCHPDFCYSNLSAPNQHSPFLCTDCHDPHGGSGNLALIREYIDTPNSGIREVVFLSYEGLNSFADGDSIYDGICEVCHTLTTYHRNDDSGNHSHNVAMDCTPCHPHEDMFMPTGGDCLDCHNRTQPEGQGDYRRQIVSNDGYGGDFLRTSHHVTDWSYNEIVTSGDCVVCHDMSQHQSLPDPEVLLNDPDGGEAILYDGTDYSLEMFCINCHDGDVGIPFSDGNIPPDIESGWPASSHEIAMLSCFGDGISTGCHENAHGSDKTTIKAPYEGSEPDEEDFCYSCHGEVMEDFSTELYGSNREGANLNAHHDVSDLDQEYSGAVIECESCHDPHALTASQIIIHDVDPNDGREPTPGNTFPNSTYLTEFCFECHDNSYPDEVIAPSVPLADVLDAWIDEGHGDRADQHGPKLASKNIVLREGSGYSRGDILQCSDCHDLGHGTSNLYQLKTVIYSKDGNTPLISDEGTTEVYVTDTSRHNEDPLSNGKNWCSTCHPRPMGSRGCFRCHNHGRNHF